MFNHRQSTGITQRAQFMRASLTAASMKRAVEAFEYPERGRRLTG